MDKGKKMSIRKINALKTQKSIFETALKLFKEKGFENVSVQEITNTAGVAKGSFYTYFKSKEDILINIYIQCDTFYKESYEQVKHLEDFYEKIYAFFHLSYNQLATLGKEIIMSAYRIQTKSFHCDYLFNKDRLLFTYLKELLLLGQNQGAISINAEPIHFMNKLYSCMIATEYTWCLGIEDNTLPEAIIENLEIFLLGYNSTIE